jgi:hypothetical protein
MAIIDNLSFDAELDEASGVAVDSVSGNDLTDNNTVGTNGSGWRDFEADNVEYFSHADIAALSTGDIDFTWEVWVQLESKTNTRNIIRKWDGSGHEYIIWFDPTGALGTADRFGMVVLGSALQIATANNFGSPSLNTPYQIIGKVDHTIKQVSIKINNGTADTATYSGTMTDTAAAFYLGHNPDGNDDWDGLMRRARFWKRKTTDDEDTWLYNSGAGRSYADIVAEATPPRRWLLVR